MGDKFGGFWGSGDGGCWGGWGGFGGGVEVVKWGYPWEI